MRRFRTRLRVSEKPGEGIVTNADVESEKAALKILKRDFPDFGVLAEESSPVKGRSAGRWIIDPLDGTSNFAHGVPNFCVAIAAEWNGEIVVGVTYHPVLDETYVAVLGKGAFVEGPKVKKKLKVSSTRRLSDSLLTTGFSNRKDKWLTQELDTFEKLSRAAQGVRRPGSAALDMAFVARGIYDGFWERGLSPWDVAAGTLLIKEAGGTVTDFNGARSSFMNPGDIIGSNGHLHRLLLKEGHFAGEQEKNGKSLNKGLTENFSPQSLDFGSVRVID